MQKAEQLIVQRRGTSQRISCRGALKCWTHASAVDTKNETDRLVHYAVLPLLYGIHAVFLRDSLDPRSYVSHKCGNVDRASEAEVSKPDEPGR